MDGKVLTRPICTSGACEFPVAALESLEQVVAGKRPEREGSGGGGGQRPGRQFPRVLLVELSLPIVRYGGGVGPVVRRD